MSLWLEGLSHELLHIGQYYGVNPQASPSVQKQQAKCIFAYLSMDVPRAWWRGALKSGRIDESHMQILNGLYKELGNLPELDGRIDPALLIALSYIDVLYNQLSSKYGKYPNQFSLNEYLEMAQKAERDHPDLYKLREMIGDSPKGKAPMKEGLMNKQQREISSWRVVSELTRRFPNKFTVILTHPGGGMYDCLSLYNPKEEHCADFNRGGTFHVFKRFDGIVAEDPGYDIWAELSRNDDYKDILDKISRMMGLNVPKHLPSSTATVIVYRFIAAFLAHSYLGLEYWECRNGMFDSSAPYECGGVTSDFDGFPEAKERLRVSLKGDILNQPSYRFWFLKKNKEPLICIETTGTLWTRDGGAYDLMGMYKKERRIWPLIIQAAGNLLP